MLKFIKDNKQIFLVLICAVILFFPIFGIYFTGDDFFHFKASQTDGSLWGFVKLFGFYPYSQRAVAFYRPIFREALYHAFYGLFGLNHLPFKILQMAFHMVNIVLVYVLFLKFSKNKFIATISCLLFGLSAANVGSLFYLAGGIQAQGALMFSLLAMISYLAKRKILPFIFFVLAISSHEIALGLPLLLVGLKFVHAKNIRLKDYFEFVPYFVILASYLYLNVFVIGFSSGEVQYRPTLNPKTLANTLSWYGVWTLGTPEMLVDYVGSGLSLNPDLLKIWGSYFRIIYPAFFGLVVLMVVFIIKSAKRLVREKSVWFLLGWFIVGLMPVALLPLHKKTYYLQISLPAFYGLVGYLIASSKIAKFFVGSFLVLFLVLNITSVQLANKTYWAGQRGKAAWKLVSDFKNQYPTLPRGAVVYIKNDPTYPYINDQWGGTSKQAYFILNGSDALQLVYDDPSLEVYYQDFEGPKAAHVYEFVAKLQ